MTEYDVTRSSDSPGLRALLMPHEDSGIIPPVIPGRLSEVHASYEDLKASWKTTGPAQASVLRHGLTYRLPVPILLSVYLAYR